MWKSPILLKLGLITGFAALAISCNPNTMNTHLEHSATTTDNPWSTIFNDVPPIRVKDPKAAAIGAVAEGREPVFEITLTDVGLYFGYIFPPVIAGYFMTDFALKQLYPDALPVRGQIRLAAQSETDFMLVASYITGARPFYFVRGIGTSDLVVDPSLRSDDSYTMVFQRKDTGRTVRVRFNRKVHQPNDDAYRYIAGASISLLNGQAVEDSTEAKNRMIALMERSLRIVDGVYEVEVIEGYTMPAGR